MQESNGAQAPQPAEHVVPQTVSTTYQSNPFLVNARGIVSILQANPATALLLGLVLGAIFFVAFILVFFIGAMIHNSFVSVLIGLIGMIGYLAFIAISVGSYMSVGSASTRGQTISVKQAIKQATAKALPLTGAAIVAFLAIAVGFALLIIPGLIALGRLSLTLVVMMEENLGAFASVKRSWRLTKGHTMEMLGAIFAGEFMSGGGLLGPTTAIAPLFGRYQDLTALERSGQAKPPTHWLNYLALILIIPLVALGVFVGIASNNSSKLNKDYNTRVQQQLDELNKNNNLQGSGTLNGGDYNSDSGSDSNGSSSSDGSTLNW